MSKQQTIYIKDKLGRMRHFDISDEVAVYIRLLENAIVNESFEKIKSVYPHRFASSKRMYKMGSFEEQEKHRKTAPPAPPEDNSKPIIVELK